MERKLAAVVAADIVGYSRLMGEDEAGTLAAVGALRRAIIDPAIAARGGRLVKAMGDGFLLEFASAVEAVECAVEVQGRVAEMTGETKAAQSIELRIGVNVGDIMVEDDDVFVDGLTEDIITALSYWRWFPVVARNSTFAYKGKPKNATEIGRELAAAYLVEGSARRVGEQVRITVQLIEAATGHHLFAERYDRGMADVFIVQDEIAERIVASIEPEIHRAEARRAARKHPSDLGAWDHALKALSLQERMTPAGHAEARSQLERALHIDPTSARAWSLLSLCHYHEGILG